jgi:nitrite reductase/ring-hydroxylating ferredoxin subunit
MVTTDGEHGIRVASIQQLNASQRLLVVVDGREIGLIARNGSAVAYENNCPHQGGPVCEGKLVARVEAIVEADGSVVGERFVRDEMRLVCPWHGYEYDLGTGVCIGDRRMRLRKWDVVTRGEDVYVREH